MQFMKDTKIINVYHFIICDHKSFYQAGDLKKHIKTVHEGHKDHKCGSCSKSYFQAGDLKIHIKTVHKGHKDHKCESCNNNKEISNVIFVENYFLE